MRWDIRTTTGDETCIADEWVLGPDSVLIFYKGQPRELVIAFGPAHWIHFAPHLEDDE